ncbi:sodium-dependent bicarbonate transport family permease [Rhodoferax aquaticus]|uniref:Sodium-dependent bicarbonate transport family permease n=1 Tax=Rhodoferax aquaticus TaxID=2527691 RepID=A0A515EUT7_9BURK|nr:sodium-dependent bicarbonate transport family permease [Rhodoferax aquaticus]QDL56333.1 sodium-dependent bicarbonate transport family permease [Rhodoferax aquaticus]
MQSFLDPAILFFVFGIFAGTLKSNLEIPAPISRFLSLYLLMALGLKGGFALAKSGFTLEVGLSLSAALLMACIVPMLGYLLLRRFLNGFDAAAIAATYGSVSAVTFITAVQYLDNHGVAYGGHMAAAMALMESPAIIMAVVLANYVRQKAGTTAVGHTLGKTLHESLTDGAQLLLLGAMAIGVITGESGQAIMKPFSVDLFKGMLAFFLLDMGLLAARNMGELKGKSPWLIAYAILAPLVHASLALLLGKLLGLEAGNVALLMVLAASASYIAVPAVVRLAIPEANPSLYFGMSLGLTFPFNILLGIPLYVGVATAMV